MRSAKTGEVSFQGKTIGAVAAARTPGMTSRQLAHSSPGTDPFTARGRACRRTDGLCSRLPMVHAPQVRVERRAEDMLGAVDHMEIWDRAAWTEYQAHLEEEADAPADVHPAS